MSKHDPPPGDGDAPGEGVTLKRLCVLLETYGARPDRWPDGERASAEALLARSPAARALAGDEASLDDLLGHAAAPAPSAALRARVLGLAAAPAAQPAPVASPAALPAADVVALRRPAAMGYRRSPGSSAPFSAARFCARWRWRRPSPSASSSAS